MKRLAGKLLITAGILAIVTGVAFALPPSRQGPVDFRTGRYFSTGQKAPRFPKELLRTRLSAQKGKYPYSPNALASSRAGVRPLAISPAPGGSVRPLVVLLDFADKQRTEQPAAFVPLFYNTAPAALSVANYWKEVSYGRFTVNGSATDIVGWVRPAATPSQPGEFLSTITSYSQITDPVTGVNLANMSQLIRDLVAYLDTLCFGGTVSHPVARMSAVARTQRPLSHWIPAGDPLKLSIELTSRSITRVSIEALFWFVLEGVVALAALIFIVWWTWPKGRDDEARKSSSDHD